MLYGKKINAVPRTKTPEQALAALMRLCARAERSEEDARRLMTRWGVAPADRERVLERLRRDRFIDDARYAEAFVREKINLSGWGARKIADALHRKRIARETIERALAALDAGTARERLADLLRRPRITYEELAPFDPERPPLPREIVQEVEITIKYQGYIDRQLRQVAEMKKLEDRPLPPDLDYEAIGGLRLEARQKLTAIRPRSLGQAARISGVSPADIAALMIALQEG